MKEIIELALLILFLLFMIIMYLSMIEEYNYDNKREEE